MLQLALVEDDPMAAELLKDYLSTEEMRIERHFETAEAALEALQAPPLPDLVLMDIGLPGLSGIEATRRLKARFPELEVVILTTFEDSRSVVEAIKAGASGYLLKASSQQQIREALLEVMRGGSYLSGRIARKVLQEFRSTVPVLPKAGLQEELTEREREILDLLVAGVSYKGIAQRLGISVHTVNSHIRHIYEKLHVNSRAEAAAKVLGSG